MRGYRVDSISCRWGFDLVSGYTAKPIPPGSNMSLEELRKGKYVLGEKEWLTVRILNVRRTIKTYTPSRALFSEFYFSSPSRASLAWSLPPFATSKVSVYWCVPILARP